VTRAAKDDRRRLASHVFARGLALFLGVFSLANASAQLRGLPNTGDIWWIDLGVLPAWLAGVFGLLAAALLLAWGITPAGSRQRLRATAVYAFVLAFVALVNALGFYRAWLSASIAPGLGVPASLIYAGGLAWIGREALRPVPAGDQAGPRVSRRTRATFAVALALAMLFPVLQIAFFGTTDYRRPADAAVVLGAKVHANGVLSTSLSDRVNTAVDLYDSGLVRTLIMSGGVGESGLDEAAAMRDRAVALGVPETAIRLDSEGVNTDATVANTTAILRETGARRVLVVSQFYHLPRIKLAYRAAGWDVQTVPAVESLPIPQTPPYVLREIPAFWTYWVRSVLGA